MQVQIDRLGKRFGSTRVLEDVSLAIAPGDIVAVIGLNGAGKTTLLRCLAGIVSPTSGALRCDGEALRRDDLAQRRRQLFLPDFPSFFGGGSALHHLDVMLRLYQREVADAELVRVLGELDLLPLVEAPLLTLSRGQGYKCALAALLLVRPELWLLDEPFASGMDPRGMSALKSEARAAAAAGASIVYSTQILEIAERFADRIVVLDRGRVRLSLGRDELAALPREGAGSLEERLREFREPAS